jgi:hypothetical protein
MTKIIGSSVWDGMPSHRRGKPHAIEDIQFAEIGRDSRIVCACGWRQTAPTHEQIEKAYWQHRREVGSPVSIMQVIPENSR